MMLIIIISETVTCCAGLTSDNQNQPDCDKMWYNGRQIRQKEETALCLLRQNEEIRLNYDRLRKF